MLPHLSLNKAIGSIFVVLTHGAICIHALYENVLLKKQKFFEIFEFQRICASNGHKCLNFWQHQSFAAQESNDFLWVNDEILLYSQQRDCDV